MDKILDFLTAVFVEGSLTILWVGLIFIAANKKMLYEFGPFGAIRKLLSSAFIYDKKYFGFSIGLISIALFLSISYPVGIMIQRVSDEHIETTSKITPIEIDLHAKSIEFAGSDRKLRLKAMLRYLPEEDLMKVAEKLNLDSDNPRISLDHKKSELNKKKQDKIYKELKTYLRCYRIKSFGNKDKNPYVKSSLEKVRVSQALAMHTWITGWILFTIGILSLLNGKWRYCALIIPLFIAMWSVMAHSAWKINFMLLLLYLAIITPLFKAIKSNDFKGRHASKFLSLAVISIVISLLSSFAWSEYRFSYFETVIVLGSQ